MNKVALVTGSGARRVGNAVALALADKGYNIAVHYNTSQAEAENTVKELEKKGVEARAYQADLTQEEQVRGLVKKIVDDFGKIDVLVHTAAAWKSKKFEETTTKDYEFFWRVNTLSTALCGQYAGLQMTKQKEGGSIILISDWAIQRPYQEHAAYFASKGAIPTLTRAFARELAERNPNVRVNCIAPGPVMLPEDLPEEVKLAAINGTLVKREGSPQNISQAALHFIENDFVTGQVLCVDGGRSIYAYGEE
jgi:pteridine reductase